MGHFGKMNFVKFGKLCSVLCRQLFYLEWIYSLMN